MQKLYFLVVVSPSFITHSHSGLQLIILPQLEYLLPSVHTYGLIPVLSLPNTVFMVLYGSFVHDNFIFSTSILFVQDVA